MKMKKMSIFLMAVCFLATLTLVIRWKLHERFEIRITCKRAILDLFTDQELYKIKRKRFARNLIELEKFTTRKNEISRNLDLKFNLACGQAPNIAVSKKNGDYWVEFKLRNKYNIPCVLKLHRDQLIVNKGCVFISSSRDIRFSEIVRSFNRVKL